MSASWPGCSTAWIVATSSSGVCGRSCNSLERLSLEMEEARLDLADCAAGSGMRTTSATKNGQPLR